MIVLNEESADIQQLFSRKKIVGEGEIPTPFISPSKMWCPCYEVFKLQQQPMDGYEESFESRGYKDSGNSRHQAIQKFLIENPDVEWIDPAKFIEENNLPFRVKNSSRFDELVAKGFTQEEARNLLGEYEVNLIHLNGLLSLKLDGIIKYKGIYYIVEIKTCSKRDLAKSPLSKHQNQGLTYSMLLKIERVLWIYEARETFETKTTVQKIRPEEWQEVRHKLNNIIKYKDNPLLLERNLQRCVYCRYRSHCEKVFSQENQTSTVLPF